MQVIRTVCCCCRAVQTPYQIRITDFGLATLLNYSEENFTSTGGKVHYFNHISTIFLSYHKSLR